MNSPLKEYEKIDDLGIGGLRIIQSGKNFRFGTDAVILAYFTKIRKGSKVVDLGTGTGIIPILLSSRGIAQKLIGVEIQPQMADMAKRSVLLNGLEDSVEILCEDMNRADQFLPKHEYEVVVTNPPYKEMGGGLQSGREAVDIARQEICATIDDVVRTAAYLLKPSGKLFIIYRPERLCDLFVSMREHKIEPKRIRFVCPREGEAAVLVLAEGIKYARHKLIMEPPLYLNGEEDRHSEEMKRIYSGKWR